MVIRPSLPRSKIDGSSRKSCLPDPRLMISSLPSSILMSSAVPSADVCNLICEIFFSARRSTMYSICRGLAKPHPPCSSRAYPSLISEPCKSSHREFFFCPHFHSAAHLAKIGDE